MSKPAISQVNWNAMLATLLEQGFSETEAKQIIESEKYELCFVAEINRAKERSAKAEKAASVQTPRCVEIKEKEKKEHPLSIRNGDFPGGLVELETAFDREEFEREQRIRRARELADEQVAIQLSSAEWDEELARSLANRDDGVGSLYPVLPERGWH